MRLLLYAFSLTLGIVRAAKQEAWFSPNYDTSLAQTPSIPVNLEGLYNNRGFGKILNESNFDGFGSAYPAQYIPSPNFTLRTNLPLTPGKYSSLCKLASSQYGQASGNIIAHYNGSSDIRPVLIPSWRNWPYPSGGNIVFPYYLTASGINYNRSNIYQCCTWLDEKKTLTPGHIHLLAPGDRPVIEVGVVNVEGIPVGTFGEAQVVIEGKEFISNKYTFNATYGIVQYSPTYDSIHAHVSPTWFNEAKFGIFIHWGVYAVPAWGNVGKNETYAEWYWWYLNQGPRTKSQTYPYHLKHYNTNITYDDFIANFTASAFNPKEWVDLFADSEAKYFVIVTKHHDGYALFDLPSKVSRRTSVTLPPHRNLVKELFDAAKTYQSTLRRGTYFSVPEWFHPDYAKYGFGDWSGGLAKNPFTNQTIPYTGYVPVKDYLEDLLLPSMQTLAGLGTEIMWYDIGGPNLTAQFAASWYNSVAESGRQVTMNNRCGLPGDLDTPEYPRSSPPVARGRKWEANLGMDPYSYGYNAATPDSAYMNASKIVTTLVDMVSKGGNFLLDIGPKADGSIVEAEAKALREAGVWIKEHPEAIYGTKTWWVNQQEGADTRYATSDDAFFIYFLKQPVGKVFLESPVPWVEGDKVTVVGGKRPGVVIGSRKDVNGRLVLDIAEDIAQADKWVWIVKISF
ncbi:glycoside hydrolase [Tothia fuscella]|uniref:alpha-L-fucosidase n=1 Tax=Tothia fuscella TaxID=1048955 RepID=A0A9P4NS33_9PEZI|nr:glycoside hydrolase [Tothia fuscella]